MRNILWVVAVVLAGCGVSASEGVSVQALSCNPLDCPGNSHLLGALDPYELDQTGFQFSERGYRIIGMTHEGVQATDLQIDGTRVEAMAGGQVVTGVGLKLSLLHRPTRRIYDLFITARTQVPYYAAENNSDAFWGYHVVYGLSDTTVLKDLCPYADYVDHDVAGSWAVFWKGDRYDPDTGEIFANDGEVGPWFNISCAGEATIKMLRARTGGAVAPASPPAQRQATLNMFTASYCGPTGERYTELGQQVAWSDLSGPSEIGEVESYEAVWSEQGAECLNEPRFVDPGKIECKSDLPPCKQSMIMNWQQYGLLLSGNPPPPPEP